MSNVKIALRVRPLSMLESLDENSSKSVVKVEDDQTVAITNLKVPTSNAGDSRERVKRFNFDYCFDSSNSTAENFSTQEKIFEKLGEIVLSSIARGQDACVLAYGQSASGKTHTMQGTENQPGLAPRLCDAIMEASGDGNAEAVVSYYEIYNERVRDLLSPADADGAQQGKEPPGPSANQLRGLRVREHPRKGPYVEDLSELTVRSRDQLSSVLTQAAARRRSAATRSNPQSSRSHALLALRGAATLTLLDLAGSERPSRVNQSLSRQKEGASINRSLVALANVISALATPSPRGNRYVPYRDSVLTWLLKDTLSGLTTTIMIATVSPSSSCYAETVNTMRWAARAGRIPPGAGAAARGPRAASERSLRALRAEVARLRQLLEATKARVAAPFAHQTTQVSFDVAANDARKQTKSPEETRDISDISDCTIKEESTLGKLGQERDGADSLASSRMSIASNDTLSGNNSIPSTRSNVHSSQTEDLLFGPRLHRTGSVHEVPLPPLRNKKRQYSSHEVLPSSEKYNSFRIPKLTNGKTPLVRLNKNVTHRLAEREKSNLENYAPRQGEDTKDQSKTPPDSFKESLNKSHVAYQPFNKRAVIVASVTDRLYSTSKKKEETTMPVNSAQSAITKKAANEIKVYSNAKRRLLDISYKAIRATRRLRVGVAAETQTENSTSVRVKEVAIDTQNDIEPFSHNYTESDKAYRHASIETESVTLRCKEASVGPSGGSIHSDDKSVGTDKLNHNTKFVFTKTCGNMTEEARSLNVASTQTREFAPPRKKYSSFTKYLKIDRDSPAPPDDASSSPSVLNISISHDCNRFENETGGISDDSLENERHSDTKLPPVRTTPDLLNNHNPIDNANGPAGPSQIGHASSPGKLANDRIESGKATLAKCAINRDEAASERRETSKGTNYESVIKSKIQGNINQTCDRVTSTPREVIKQPGVTWRISQSAASGTERANKGVGTDERSRESYIYESKSTQVNSSGDVSCADFLEDIYVPLPRICVTSDLGSGGWPNMRSLIMGRNENVYPYNIKLSPKRCCEMNQRKKNKTVSWKSDGDLATSSNARCRLPETEFHHREVISEEPECCRQSACRVPSSKLGSGSLHQRHSNISEEPFNSYFKGIQCWNDRIQAPTAKTSSEKNKHLRKSEHFSARNQDRTCLQYMEATSNLIKEATNLVASLSKVTSKLSEPSSDNSAPPTTSISRVCNEQLQTVDENTNKNTIPEQYSAPSTSSDIPPLANKIDSPRTINDELIDNEEQPPNSLEYPDDHLDLFEETIFSSDDELLSTGKEIDAIEKDLFASLDRLDDRTERTKEYFSTASERYSEKFDRQLSSLPPGWQNGPMPQPRAKRNPSKYLEELRNLRRELVESTKRDDSIYRQFQMN